MEEPNSEQHRPGPTQRLLLGGLVMLFSVSTLGSLFTLVVLVLVAGLFVTVAIGLGPSGVLRDTIAFETGHWIAIGTLSFVALATAVSLAVRKPDHTQRTGPLSPVLGAAVVLGALSPIAWQMNGPRVVRAGLLLSDLYFFGLVVPAVLLWAGVVLTWRSYLWASASKPRAGMMAVLLALGLVAIGFGGATAKPVPTSVDRWPDGGLIEAERQSLDAIASVASAFASLGKPAASLHPPTGGTVPLAVSAAPLASASSPSGLTSPAASGEVETCLRRLVPKIAEARDILARNHGMTRDDAHDLVADTMLKVCIHYPTRTDDELGALLYRSATNRAKSEWRRRRLEACLIDEDTLPCPSGPSPERLLDVDRILDLSICKEDELHREVIRRHLSGDSLAEIDVALGLPPDRARNMFNNAVRRARRRLDRCAELKP